MKRWFSVVVLWSTLALILGESPSCSRLDFDQATVTFLLPCSQNEAFSTKRYEDSSYFTPYRPGAQYYLSNEWQGLSCGETVEAYSFNEETELRMAYNLILSSGAKLEVRVVDLDRLDSAGKPILVEQWRTEQSSEGWGHFRERLNKVVKRAKIQIEANMTAGSEMAIEYLTVFNYEVETNECLNVDEFATTLTESATTTQETMNTSTIESMTTTSTNSPRDDAMTTMLSTDSIDLSTLDSASAIPPTTEPIQLVSSVRVWMSLTTVFAFMFLIMSTVAAYLCAIRRHLVAQQSDKKNSFRMHRVIKV